MSEHFARPTRSLKGKVAIVTGAGALGEGIGNGRASAVLLAEAGYDFFPQRAMIPALKAYLAALLFV